MRGLVYLSVAEYPSVTAANSIQSFEMARVLNSLLGDDFTFVASKKDEKMFKNIRALETGSAKYRKLHLVTVFYFFWLMKFLRKRKSQDIIFYLKDNKLALLLLTMRTIFKLRYKIAFEYHQRFGSFYDRPISRRADYFFPLTRIMKEELIRSYGVSPTKFLVSPDGVDLDNFAIQEDRRTCRQELRLPLDKKIVSYVGTASTLGSGKGLGTILKAAAALRERKDIVFCLIGFKPGEFGEYAARLEGMGLNNVHLFEYQPRELIPKYLKASDALLMPFPNKPHFAGCMSPLKLFEYMASGRPIIASDLPSVREILSDGEALFIEPGSSKALAGAVIQLSDDRKRGEVMAQNAFNKVHGYAWKRRAEKIVNFIYAR